MRRKGFLLVTVVTVLFGLTRSTPAPLEAQGASALTGAVSSAEEGKMEGVVVTARRDGGIFTVSVVSDAEGRYSFPRTHLEPGRYTLRIRAVGFDLNSPASVEVTAGKGAVMDLSLVKTKDLASQLVSRDWVMSWPVTEAQRERFVYQAASCNYCHNYLRIVRSKHNAEQFAAAIRRMNTYYPDGSASSNDGRGRGQVMMKYGESSGRALGENKPPSKDIYFYSQVPVTEFAEFLATVNLSGGKTTWPYELKSTMPRPKAKGTRVIVTEWDMPRRDTVSHDSAVDSKGTFWFTDESRQFISKLEPKTNKITEYPLPAVPADVLQGTRDVVVDKDDIIWFPMRVPSGESLLTKFDPKTQQVTSIPGATGQFIALGPNNTIWMGGAGAPFIRVDTKAMKVDGTWKAGGYQVVVSSKGVPYIGGGPGVNSVDLATGEPKGYAVPTPRSFTRRGWMDPQDRFWVAEYYGDKIAMFDTRTEKFEEWFVGRKFMTPYTVSAPDKNGRVYAPSNMTDRVVRLDPKTGELVEYLMPGELDSKKLTIDPSTSRVTIWMSNTRNARVLRIEPLD